MRDRGTARSKGLRDSGFEGGPGGSGGPRRRERGVPDSVLVGVLAFLLGLTILVWLATGLSGLFAHGSWPEGVTFTRTPLAMRELVAQPHDLATAWPDTPRGHLSGYGLFWGIFISELMVLFVLTLFALGTITRFRAVRAQRRAERPAGRGAVPVEETTAGGTTGTDPAGVTPSTAGAAGAGPSATGTTAAGTAAGAATGPVAGVTAAGPDTAVGTGIPAGPGTGLEATPGAAPTAPAPAPSAAPVEALTVAAAVPAATTTDHPAPTGVPLPQPADGLPAPAALPRVHYGTDRAAARHAALSAVTAAEGPLLVATTDPSLWSETKDARSKLGPVHAYDPLHRLDTPARLRWSPTAGCQDIAAAGARAAALLAPVRPMSSLDSALADAAETLLRCWLHAAAVDGRPFRQIHRWAAGSGAAHEPVRILRTNSKAAAGRAGELESVLTAHPERRDMAQQLVARALAALSSVHIRDACNPGRADALALESFVAEGGTLYVVGEAIEDPRTAPGAMPLLTALVSSVVERGRRMAERSSDGRLDPPITLVLDDIAALAPFPALPEVIGSGAAQGLLTLATLRSPEQARARWPHASLPA